MPNASSSQRKMSLRSGTHCASAACLRMLRSIRRRASPSTTTTARPRTHAPRIPWTSSKMRIPDYNDDSKTENTRAAYPVDFIENALIPGIGGHPKNVVFLTADAFGVLPPISKLTPEQAMYHFLSGYTAKVAGTEAGVKEPSATFSTCFGSPFLPLPPKTYAEMLGRRLREHHAQCWLVNTGWQGGPYGVGKRMDIPHTRAMVDAAVEGELIGEEFEIEPTFGFSIPKACHGVPAQVLNP